MYIPRFAYNDQGEILYIKQGCSVAGNYTIPEIFTYETEKMDLSLAGIWVEYNPLSSKNEVNTKVKNMTGENNTYGFIANTIATNANNENSYKTTIEIFIANTVGADASVRPQITNLTNPNRTILKIINTNRLEPIKGKAYYDAEEEKIKVEVTYSKNEITKILNSKGEILSENSLIADSGDELIGNGTYKYIVIDNIGNIRKITVQVEGLKIYIIPDLETLKKFRDEVNAGNQFSGMKVIQTADIDLNPRKHWTNEETGIEEFASDAEQWNPIGNNNSYHFQGTYDGRGHTISGMYINNSNAHYCGFFCYASNGTIRNLNVIESYINARGSIGGIVYHFSGGTIENCSNETTIISTDSLNGNEIGGIVVYAYNVTINNCYNKGNITGSGNVGGIAGYASDNVTITNCYNTGKITGAYGIGGIKGYSNGGIIENCYNVGEITGSYELGGIVGRNYYREDINKCYNLGKISGTSRNIGSLMGYPQGGVTLGELGWLEETAAFALGGYWGVDQGTNGENEECVVYSDEAGLISQILTIDAFIEDTNNINNGYPILKWQVETAE